MATTTTRTTGTTGKPARKGSTPPVAVPTVDEQAAAALLAMPDTLPVSVPGAEFGDVAAALAVGPATTPATLAKEAGPAPAYSGPIALRGPSVPNGTRCVAAMVIVVQHTGPGVPPGSTFSSDCPCYGTVRAADGTARSWYGCWDYSVKMFAAAADAAAAKVRACPTGTSRGKDGPRPWQVTAGGVVLWDMGRDVAIDCGPAAATGLVLPSGKPVSVRSLYDAGFSPALRGKVGVGGRTADNWIGCKPSYRWTGEPITLDAIEA